MGPIDALILDREQRRRAGPGRDEQPFPARRVGRPSTEGMKCPPTRSSPRRRSLHARQVVVLVNKNWPRPARSFPERQDWDRGLIVGRRTFGTGLVQRQFPLSDGSAVRLTVSRYHTPTGRVIQRPFEKGNRDAYYEDFVRRFDDGAVDSVGVDSTQMYRTLRSGRTVYGGGGIAPDIVVPVDTSGYTKYWSNLIRKGVVGDFVIDYMDRNRASLSARYPKAEKFAANTSPQEALDELVRAGERAGVEFERRNSNARKKEIALQLKALIAQKLWYQRILSGLQHRRSGSGQSAGGSPKLGPLRHGHFVLTGKVVREE
ncbi:MAG: S41 family peptidase [Alistipes onderdonkii]